MSAPRKEVEVAQDAMEDDSDNQMKGTITAQQDTTEVKFGAKELVTEAYHNVKRIIGEGCPIEALD
jgi:hypothetical protein